ncbi:saccharopine dehydrogenase NADP-binding domain-containing protein [Myxococcota bacterium]|nr:saccharopine dehydrogenase NADP-binding domain-containing protein [Myxococcota bacterium]
MARILILGGGRQGRVIARDLSTDHDVTIADAAPPAIPNVHVVTADLSKNETVERLVRAYDLAVGALPAKLGFNAACAAISAGRDYVDISFFEEDIERLGKAAAAQEIAFMPDCGVAPGLSNLVVGRALTKKRAENVQIMVGGVPQDASLPYGYTVTWALPDLMDEYTRPARIIRDGEVVTVPALSELELIRCPGAGKFEAFTTDGLRTLLRLKSRVTNMTEKTMRWPGHVEAIRPLLKEGKLLEELESKCPHDAPDLLVMSIVVDDRKTLLTVRATDELSAMARSTALTAASFADYIARFGRPHAGLLTPEDLGKSDKAYEFILKRLADRGIQFDKELPFD